MRPRRFRLLGFLLVALLLAGCSSTRQIRTAPPRPAGPPGTSASEAGAAGAGVVVSFETGTTPLPGDVQTLRFRLSDVRFRSRGGEWFTYPADVQRVELTAGSGPVRRTILTSRLPAAVYDSVAVTLADLYVEFGPDAGGPVTSPGTAPVRLALPLDTRGKTPFSLRLTLEPGASLSRNADCRWIFVPFLDAIVEPLDTSASVR